MPSLSAPVYHLLWHWTVPDRARLFLQREVALQWRMLQMLGNPAAACWQSHSMLLDSLAPPPSCPIMGMAPAEPISRAQFKLKCHTLTS